MRRTDEDVRESGIKMADGDLGSARLSMDSLLSDTINITPLDQITDFHLKKLEDGSNIKELTEEEIVYLDSLAAIDPVYDTQTRSIIYEVTKKRYLRKPWVIGDTLAGKSMEAKPTKVSSDRQLLIYPNPTSLSIRIEIIGEENPIKVMILDAKGSTIKELMNFNQKSGINLNVQNFPSGLYLIQVVCSDEILQQKFIKN